MVSAELQRLIRKCWATLLLWSIGSTNTPVFMIHTRYLTDTQSTYLTDTQRQSESLMLFTFFQFEVHAFLLVSFFLLLSFFMLLLYFFQRWWMLSFVFVKLHWLRICLVVKFLWETCFHLNEVGWSFNVLRGKVCFACDSIFFCALISFFMMRIGSNGYGLCLLKSMNINLYEFVAFHYVHNNSNCFGWIIMVYSDSLVRCFW